MLCQIKDHCHLFYQTMRNVGVVAALFHQGSLLQVGVLGMRRPSNINSSLICVYERMI